MTPLNQEEISVRILAGWQKCYWCERLHHPDDLIHWASNIKMPPSAWRYACRTCRQLTVEDCKHCKASFPNGI